MRPTREGRHTPFRAGLIFSGLGVDPDIPVDDPEPPTNWAASSNSGQAFVPFLPPPEAGDTEDLNLSVGTDTDGGGTRAVVDVTFANDGDQDTQAYRASFFNGGGTETWYIEADLGAAYEVSEIVVRGGSGNAGENDPPWEIEHSDDGSSWTTAAGTYVFDGGTNPRTATLTLTAAQTKRYWRLGHTISFAGLVLPVKVHSWEINGATVGTPSNVIWVEAPLAIDGSDSTFEGVPQEHSPFLRHTLDDSYLIDRARLRVSWTSNTSRTLTLQGANESDFSDAVTLDTHTYSPTGGLANPDDVNLAWSAANVYRYFQYLTSVENWYRIYESELYQAGDSTAVSVASNSLALGGVVVQNSASSNYHFVAASPTEGYWIPHDAGGASVSYGSNASHVAEVSSVGAGTAVARFDHYHAGVAQITSSSSNTLQRGTVNLRPGSGVAFGLTDTDSDGEFDTLTITSNASAGSGGGGGIESGTSFPGSPSTDDLFHRTDRDRIYFYDGTRWLSVQEFTVAWGWRAAQGPSGLNATTTMAQATVPVDDIYLTDLLTTCFVASASSGTQFWTLDITKRDAANAETSIGSVSTVSNTSANWVQEVAALNHLVDGATYPVILLIATKVSTVGTLLFGVDLRYRLVG